MANEVIFQLHKVMVRRQLNVDESLLQGWPKKKILGLALLKRTIAQQRSRISWLKEGDANTTFFTSMPALEEGGITYSDWEDRDLR
jgi:hypothetical protein